MPNHRFSIRVSGSIESLAQLMIAVSTALSGSWIEQRDSDALPHRSRADDRDMAQRTRRRGCHACRRLAAEWKSCVKNRGALPE